jgi:uncharacterized phage-associated protein
MINNKKVCSIIYFFIKNSSNLGKTKLIKLMYLADYEFYKQYNKKISNIDYIRWDYGPFSPDIYTCLEFMADSGIIKMKKSKSLNKSRDYFSFHIKEEFDVDKNLSPDEKEFFNYILSKYDNMDIDTIKKITYETEPMLEASNKGDLLKFESIDKVLLKKLKELGNKVESLKNYKGNPFDPKDSLGDDNLIKYQYDLTSK